MQDNIHNLISCIPLDNILLLSDPKWVIPDFVCLGRRVRWYDSNCVIIFLSKGVVTLEELDSERDNLVAVITVASN